MNSLYNWNIIIKTYNIKIHEQEKGNKYMYKNIGKIAYHNEYLAYSKVVFC